MNHNGFIKPIDDWQVVIGKKDCPHHPPDTVEVRAQIVGWKRLELCNHATAHHTWFGECNPLTCPVRKGARHGTW